MEKSKEAKVRVGVEGQEKAEEAARSVGSAWKRAGGMVSSAFLSTRQAIGGELKGIASDALRTVTVMRTLSVGEAVHSARELRKEYTQLGVAAGTSVGDMKSKLEGVSRQTLVGEEHIAAWSRQFGRVTYSISGAVNSFAALHAESIATGKSIDELGQLGATLKQNLGVTEDMGGALAKIRAQAEALGTVGGVSAFQDQLQSAVSSMVGLTEATEEQRNKFTALVGLMGKGLAPKAAQAAQQGMMSFVEQRAPMLSMLGNIDIYNAETGQLDPEKYAEGMRWLQKKYQKWIPDKKLRTQALRGAFGGGEQGAIAAAAFERGDFSEEAIKKVAGVAPSKGAEEAARTMHGSAAGHAEEHELEAARAMRQASEKLLDASDKFSATFAHSPILGLLAGSGAQALGGAGISKGIDFLSGTGKVAAPGAAATSFGGALQGGAITAAGVGKMGALGKLGMAGAVLGAGAAGYMAGSALDEHFGLSDLISGTGRHSSAQRESAERLAVEQRGDAEAKSKRNEMAGEIAKSFAEHGDVSGVSAETMKQIQPGGNAFLRDVVRAMEKEKLDFGRLPPSMAKEIVAALRGTQLEVRLAPTLSAPPEMTQ